MLTLKFTKGTIPTNSTSATLFNLGTYRVWVPNQFCLPDDEIEITEQFKFTTRTSEGKMHRTFYDIELAEEFPDAVEVVE